MSQMVWTTSQSASELLAVLRRLVDQKKYSRRRAERKLRLFAAGQARRFRPLAKIRVECERLVTLAERRADGLVPAEEFEEESLNARQDFDVDWTGFIEGGSVSWGDEECNRAGLVRWAARDLAYYATTPDPWEAAERAIACVQALATRRAAKTAANRRKLADREFEYSEYYENALLALVPPGTTDAEEWELCEWFRDVFGNPFRRLSADPKWLTTTVVDLAREIDVERAFDQLPILADALEEAGCNSALIRDHCRHSTTHGRGCWVLDLVRSAD